ncbi:Hypothetical protein, putative [Bodo saltans]|uniref:Protein kinase n=1 Tax=Bodo saltans TaxID=75058 RepID=A0A0S4IZ07_BODSA|nr:Hypothetical protein, putative [Bodo saltans]|eukprot:CUG18757.1 Hypothetical protein, putative [Bodo saltans]
MLLEQLMHADTRHRATMKVAIQRIQELVPRLALKPYVYNQSRHQLLGVLT